MQFFSLESRLRRMGRRYLVFSKMQYPLIYFPGGQKNRREDTKDQVGGVFRKTELEAGGKRAAPLGSLRRKVRGRRINSLASNACLR
jgi:hypothetical protein